MTFTYILMEQVSFKVLSNSLRCLITRSPKGAVQGPSPRLPDSHQRDIGWALRRFRKVWEGLGRFGKVWEGLGRFGKVWEGLGGFGKVWEGLGRL